MTPYKLKRGPAARRAMDQQRAAFRGSLRGTLPLHKVQLNFIDTVNYVVIVFQ